MASFGSATLILIGPKGTTNVEISLAKAVIGRADSGNDVVVSDRSVSDHHCEFVCEEQQLVLRDLGSANGTFVNGRRIHAARVYDGDLVRIGEAEGHIHVRSTKGRPIRAPGDLVLMPVATALLALLLLGAGAFVFWFIHQRIRERELFVEYEIQAQAFLQLPSPCAATRDVLRRLGETEERLDKLGLPGQAKRSRPLDREQYERLLTISEPREEQLKTLLAAVDESVDRPLHEKLEALRPYQGKFRSQQFASAVQTLQQLFQEELAAHERFRTNLQQYRDQVVQLNETLRKLSESDVQTAESTSPAPKVLRAVEMQQECELTFSQLSSQGMVKLASVPL